MNRTTLGTVVGLALGFALAFGGLGQMLIVALFGGLGFAVARALAGDLDLSGYLLSRRSHR
ncbi:hypothetical protein AB0368_35805 [Actinoplanes sp. NPDC051475]|uniref:hypothetical protein n=1 Tax=Actinoplanes sp. NPDC051475 TaxID=3157225 RepID=UPI00344D3CB3